MQNNKISHGLSRASLKRKKKQIPKHIGDDKKLKVTSLIESSNETIKNTSKMIRDSSFSKNIDIDFDFLKFTVLDLLSKQDVTDITADERSALLIGAIIHPTTRSEFYKNHFDKSPLHCIKGSINWIKGFVSRKSIEKIWSAHLLEHFEDILVIKYVNNQLDSYSHELQDNKSSLDEPLTSKSSDIINCLESGYSIYFLQLQRYHDKLWQFLSCLEHEFLCGVSCSIIWTPSGLDGFGPVRNDSDSFFIQLAGCCTMILYQIDNDDLGTDEEQIISSVDVKLLPEKPYMTALLDSGDSLYVPRRFVYSFKASLGESPSIILHIRTNIDNKIANYMNLIITQGMKAATKPNSILCRVLPRDYLSFMGVSVNEDENDMKRNEFLKILENSLDSVRKEALDLADAAADQMAKKIIAQRLPIPLTSYEEERSASGAPNATIYSYSKLRMLRPHIARAMVEDGMVVVYHCMDNARTLYGSPLNPLEFDLDDGPAIEGLLSSYPVGIIVSDLYHPSEEIDDKIGVAQALYKEGFLLIMDEVTADIKNEDNNSDDDPF